MSSEEAVIYVRRAAGDVLGAIDLDHEDWDAAQPVRLAHYWSGATAPDARQAEVRALWHAGGLCVRFLCRQREALVVHRHPQTARKTIGLWERDVCEVFVAPDAENPAVYFEFEAAPTGEWLDLALRTTPAGRVTNWEYGSGMNALARVGVDEVTVAMFVPWPAFGVPAPKAGARWRGNFFRCVGACADRGYLAWQPTRTVEPNFHVPQAFGWLEFR